MAKVIATVKAVVTRLIFAAHGMLAIWQVTIFKRDSHYWYLSAPVLLLFFEALFTLTIKRNQEWKWFCPSVFLYLASVVPAIWLLELDKLEKKQKRHGVTNSTSSSTEGLKELDQLLGPHVQLSALSISPDTWLTLIEQFLMLILNILQPHVQLSALSISPDTWLTLIEQFLMLILILGRWLLPKGDLTRDQLSQLLLVYIGTAADIIEFFDAFQDETIGGHPVLTGLTLAIWSWSLLQFTVVLTATKSSRRSRISAPLTTNNKRRKKNKKQKGCCSVDVWAIMINILLQDAPFVTFRLLLICYYRIISYMNVFFTCKNTLVIALQLYRLHVVYAEKRAAANKKKKRSPDVSVILASLDRYSDVETARHKSKKGSATKRGASCSELGLESSGVNPATSCNFSDDTPPKKRAVGRRKSVSADNLRPRDSSSYSVASSEASEEEQSSSEDDLLADLTPAQLNLIMAKANKSRSGVRPQDTGYSTAASSHGGSLRKDRVSGRRQRTHEKTRGSRSNVRNSRSLLSGDERV